MMISHIIKTAGCVLIVFMISCPAWGHVNHAHFGVDDSGQLVVVELQTGHHWSAFHMHPIYDFGDGTWLFEADICLNSARQPDGRFHLGTGAPHADSPDWNIHLKRMAFPETDFFRVVTKPGPVTVLQENEAMFKLPTNWATHWPDEYGRQPGDEHYEGTWRFHYHLYVQVRGQLGQEFSTTFTVVDEGVTGYTDSDPFTMTFVTVPEPAALILFGAGGLLGLRRRR